MSYKAGIFEAIQGLGDRGGSSSIAIKKVMQAKLPKSKTWQNKTYLTALKNAVASGELVQNKGSYRLSAETKKKLAKSKTAPAKKAVKKAPAKKKTTTKKKAPAKKTTTKKKAPAKKTTTKKKAPAKKTTTKKKAPAKKTTTKKKAPAKKKTTTKKKTTKK